MMKLKRLLIEMPEKDHRLLKERASQLGLPMRRYVIDAIAVFMRHEKEFYKFRGLTPIDKNVDGD